MRVHRQPWPRLAVVVLLAAALGSPAPAAARARWVDVYLALADNQHQNIVPVPAALGNGDRPATNLYWGARYGLKSFFRRSKNWRLVGCTRPSTGPVLEVCLFRHRRQALYLLARAYRGRFIQRAIGDFLATAAGSPPPPVRALKPWPPAAGLDRQNPHLVVYLGHNGLMDFAPPRPAARPRPGVRRVIVLACAARRFFAGPLRAASAHPLLWTTGLMAPEAYTLHAAIEGWRRGGVGPAVRERAAAAYDKYQHCGLAAARRLLVTGW